MISREEELTRQGRIRLGELAYEQDATPPDRPMADPCSGHIYRINELLAERARLDARVKELESGGGTVYAKEIADLLRTIATERDAFGARECELVDEIWKLRKQKGVACMKHDLVHHLACGCCLDIARDELKFLATATTDLEFKKRIQHALGRIG